MTQRIQREMLLQVHENMEKAKGLIKRCKEDIRLSKRFLQKKGGEHLELTALETYRLKKAFARACQQPL